MDLINRNYYGKLLAIYASQYPVVTILGPRQAGKTTLARSCFSDHEYLDLELPSDYSRLANDPELFLMSRKRPIIIDEAQRYPALFPVLRAVIDRTGRHLGQYVLLGSASFSLMQQISESLAGRVAFVDLAPLSLAELPNILTVESHWLKGGFPQALLSNDPSMLNFNWFEQYTRTIIESDLPGLGMQADPLQIRRLLTMCAHSQGGVLNKNKIAASLGLASNTIDKYIRIFELTFALRLLPPFHANIKKRLVKSPKLYFRDSGLRHYFLRMMDLESLYSHPERGSSFEGYVIEQLAHAAHLRGAGEEPCFLRTSDGIEVDLLLERGNEVIAFEVKAKASPTREDITSLIKAMTLLPASRGVVISTGHDRYPITKEIDCIGIEWARQSLFEKFWE